MHRPHVHDEHCGPTCSREWDMDERTPTAAYHIMARDRYGSRKHDTKPRWWPFAYHGFKAAVQVVTVLGIAWLAKKLGLTGAAP